MWQIDLKYLKLLKYQSYQMSLLRRKYHLNLLNLK
jgi:hypothetical protein